MRNARAHPAEACPENSPLVAGGGLFGADDSLVGGQRGKTVLVAESLDTLEHRPTAAGKYARMMRMKGGKEL